MSPGQISCSSCRIRLPSGSPVIELFDGRCPICGVALVEAASASDVMGFRYLDQHAILGTPDDRHDSTVGPPELLSRRRAGSVRDADDAGRWSDDGGSALGEAAARWPALS